jgi:hypothetical protein
MKEFKANAPPPPFSHRRRSGSSPSRHTFSATEQMSRGVQTEIAGSCHACISIPKSSPTNLKLHHRLAACPDTHSDLIFVGEMSYYEFS